jgi:hypothetical protein
MRLPAGRQGIRPAMRGRECGLPDKDSGFLGQDDEESIA